MRLAIVRQRYNPYGGAERFVERAAEALSRQGATLSIVAREWSGPRGAAAWLRCDPFYLGRTWRDAAFARAACTLCREHGFDLVQSHERIACCDIYRAGDGVHAQWLAHRARSLTPLRRLALACHPYHRYVLAAERRTFASPRLRAVICNSRMVRSEVERWFGLDADRLHVVYNGVDLAHFHPGLRDEHRARMRASLGITEAAPVVLFVGSGFERKGLQRLLAAFARMKRDAQLVVVGRDAQQRGAEALARSLGVAERVHWAGGRRDVRPWYGAADLFALPTLYDPFPNAALEALASGLPVLTTANCGVAEVIVDGVNGHVCRDPLDLEELARALADALAAAPCMREAARDSARPLGIDAMAASLFELYRRLLEPRAA